MMSLKKRFETIHKEIALAAQKYSRDPNSITLLAVSKTRSVTEIRNLVACGQCDMGESYLQEALSKIKALANENIVWHFIGPIQANKTRLIAENFTWVHSVCRLRIAERLNEQRPSNLSPLNICIQVNISEEESKEGISITELLPLVEEIKKFPNLTLRGLMGIPAPCKNEKEQRKPFKLLRQAFDNLNKKSFCLDTLSMGMSDDFVPAIAEGSTIIRIGTAIFGPRKY
jgi:PLP dependent protein